MKRIASAIVLCAVLLGAGFTFAGTSRAADSTPATTTSWIGRGGPFMDAVANLLGLDRTTIMARRHGGESLASIAAAQGVAEQQLIDALKQQHVARIDELVAAGRATKAQADAYLANLDAAIKANVERTTTGRPAGVNCLGLGAVNGLGRGRGSGCGLGRGAGGRWGASQNNPVGSNSGTR